MRERGKAIGGGVGIRDWAVRGLLRPSSPLVPLMWASFLRSCALALWHQGRRWLPLRLFLVVPPICK
jgi:hypothetical protein